MAYQLSISIFGPGTSERAHWGFVIHAPPAEYGDLLYVREIDAARNWFQYEPLMSIISKEPAPRGGTKRCQDWVVDALVSLEIEELVADGTAQVWTDRVGKPTKDIKRGVGAAWTSLNGRLLG
ncbi:hypothetical protein BDV19DRAFT_384581 [Aspergillus venezuelensis]